MSRPNVLNVLTRTGGTDVSVLSRDHHSNVSVSSRSRDYDVSVSASYVSFTTLTITSDWAGVVSMTVCGPRVHKSRRQFLVNADHRYFDDVGCGTLNGRVHRLPLGLINSMTTNTIIVPL